jgi:cyclic lactone autoinducer peptide
MEAVIMTSKNQKALKVVSSIVSRIAFSASSAACAGWAYQPKTPKCLQK